MVCMKMCWRVMPPGRRRFPITTLSTVIIIIIIGLDRPDWSDAAVRQGRCAIAINRRRARKRITSTTYYFHRRLNRVVYAAVVGPRPRYCGNMTL